MTSSKAAPLRLLVLGAGGHGHVVADLARSAGSFAQIMFLDDALAGDKAGDEEGLWPVVGRLEDYAREARVPGTCFALGLGDNAARLRWLNTLLSAGADVPVLIAASAAVSPHAQLGAGTVVMPQAAVNVGARLGQACIVNTSASVDHDCVLGDAVHLSPGVHLGGNVSVGPHTWIGIGASVRHGIRIGERVMVGAGAAVVSDLPDGCTAMGVPARPR